MVSLMPILWKMVLTKQFCIYWVSRDFVEYWRTSIDSLSVFFGEFEKQYQEVEKHETILRLDLKDFFSTRRKLNLRYWARTAAKLEFDEIKQQLQNVCGEAIFNSKDGAVSVKADRHIINIKWCICDALRDLVPFVQFKKREKHLWIIVNFSKVTGFSLQHY